MRARAQGHTRATRFQNNLAYPECRQYFSLDMTAAREPVSFVAQGNIAVGAWGQTVRESIRNKGDQMNKAELVETIAKKTGGTKASVETTLDALMDTVTGVLSKGESVALIGFGTFSMARRAARKGRNPATGAEIKIPASKVAKFAAGAKLKKAVNRK